MCGGKIFIIPRRYGNLEKNIFLETVTHHLIDETFQLLLIYPKIA